MKAAQKVSGLADEVCFLGNDASTETSHLEEALAAVECDAVIIVTPPPMHAVQCRAAIAAGKHVRFSKPPYARAVQCSTVFLALC
jgi:predicted dehydrogenase